MIGIGQKVQACDPAVKCCVPPLQVSAKPADKDVVEKAFTAHLKNNPKLAFTDSYKSVTVTNGKPKGDKGWEEYSYEIKKVGTDEYVLRYERTHYDQRYKNINFQQSENAYFMIRVARNPDGTQRYRVGKYKNYYRNKVRSFAFASDTRAGSILAPASRKALAAGRAASPKPPMRTTFDKNRRRCTILDTKYIEGIFIGKSITSRTYTAATMASDGNIYRVKATYDGGSRKYFITHSQRGDGVWMQHHRRKPAPKDAVGAFYHSCSEYLVK